MSTAIAIPNQSTLAKLKNIIVKIVSPETLVTAQAHLAEVRTAIEQLKMDMAAMKKPHNEELDKINAASKPWKEWLDQRDSDVERAILAYNRQVREGTERFNQKQLEKFEKKVERVETKALADGKPIPVVLPPQMASAPAKSVVVGGGTQTTVKRKAWRLPAGYDKDTLTALDNAEQRLGIPTEYFVLDTAKVGKVVRAGGKIPGIEVYDEESISVRA